MWFSTWKRLARMPTRQPQRLFRSRLSVGLMVLHGLPGQALSVQVCPFLSTSCNSHRLRWMRYEMCLPLLMCYKTSSLMLVIFLSLPTMVQVTMGPCSTRSATDSACRFLQRFVSLIHCHWRVSCFPARIRTVLVRLLSTMIVRGQMLIAQMLMWRCLEELCLAWSVRCNRGRAELLSTNSCVALTIPGLSS